MFNRLPESKPTRQRRLGGAIVSTVVHLVFIALAVRATGLKAASAPKTEVLPIFIAPVTDPTTQPAPRTSAPPTSSPSSSNIPEPPTTPVMPNLDKITEGIPEPGLGPVELVRSTDFGPPNDNRISNGPPGGTPNVSGSAPLPENLVDKVILPLPGNAPRYPSMLQSAGVEGDVRAQFVVDTLGRVEQGSVRILDTSHALFATAVRDALARARFKPAEAGGRKVRQLAEQVFTFRITR